VKPPPGKGELFWVDVKERPSTWYDHLFPPSGSSFIKRNAVAPGLTNEQLQRENDESMVESQRIAKLVAVRSAGYDVDASAVVFVDSTIAGGPSAGKLEPGDKIVAIDGKPVAGSGSLRERITARPTGSRLAVTVLRGASGKRVTVGIKTVGDPRRHGAPIIGILPGDAVEVHLPPSLKITMDMGQVGGPSAGLGMALELYHQLGHDVTHGYRVAVTGQLEVDGRVTPIGGVKQKTIGARRAHVQVFLVPAGDNAQEARRYAGGMRIIPVTTFQQALRVLATLTRKG
jgi:PDZ domain-containing protein